MRIHRPILLAGATAALVFVSGCSTQSDKGTTIAQRAGADASAISKADAKISQPAWLSKRLPEHTVAYVRIPSLWGTLSAPDGRPLDAALANERHAQIVADLRKAAAGNQDLATAADSPLLNILLGDQASPLEMALIDASDGVSPFSRALVTVNLDLPDVAALNARIDALTRGQPSPLQAPVDASGDAPLQKFGALHFDVASHRLFLSLGANASAMTLKQDIAQTKSERSSPMQDAEKEIDGSGQGLFAWMSLKNLNIQLAGQMGDQPSDSLLRDTAENTTAIALGWGTVDGHGRLQVQVRAPKARLLGYLATNHGNIDLKTAGAPEWVATLAIPGRENLQRIHDDLDRDFGAGSQSGYDDAARKALDATGLDPIAMAGFFGGQVIAFKDANGNFVATKMRDRKGLYAKIDELSKRFGWRNEIVKVDGGQLHHVHLSFANMGKVSPDANTAAWLKLYQQMGSDLYWLDEGDYVISAKVPQPLMDRLANPPDTALADWLGKHQGYDSAHTLLGYTTTTHDVDRSVYYAYIGLLGSIGNALGKPVDLTQLPTARKLGLPTDGIAGISLQANDQRLALQVDYEQSPVEGLLTGQIGGTTAVATVAILAAIAIPAYQDYTIRSQVSEGAVLTDGPKTAVAEYYANTGRMPHDNAQAGLAAASDIQGTYVSSVKVDDGRITVTYGNQANALIRDDVLMFAPTADAGSVSWSCDSAAGSTIPAKYRPSFCRP